VTQQADLDLAKEVAQFYDDPLGFVMFAYPWDTDPALRVVELPAGYRGRYASKYGPDRWACEILDEIGEAVRERGFDGISAVEPIREAIASGHGIGKSALVAWLVGWIMSTRPSANGVVTANTGEQLSAKTWAEIAKWNRRSITGHWFEVTTGRGAMRMVHREAPESWKIVAQTCREENSEAFAGLHAASSTPFYIFDEASAVPDKIWEVAEGGLTDGEPMFFAFGNPTRNTGAFSECFGAKRHRWKTRQIDSRSVQITNKALIQQWVDDEGEDSDFVRVRVRGIFPRASLLQFIPRDLADEAATRPLPERSGLRHTALVGVDVARFGGAQSVIRTRMGRDARTWPAKKFRGLDTMQLAGQVGEHINELRRIGIREIVVFVDGGGVGGGVVDRLRQLGHDVIEVNFGGKADNQRDYANKSAEMWARGKEWLKVGCIEKDEQLLSDMTGREYGYTTEDKLVLERKESMVARGLASPDDADALFLTFAQPAMEVRSPAADAQGIARAVIAHRQKHDPFARNRLIGR
jgi:hypothetical protein